MPRLRSSVASALLLALATAGDAAAASGGPDGFGYTYVDQADGAPYTYVDITSTGTLVTTGDEGTGTVMLGEPFSLYGVSWSALAVSTNGFVTTVDGTAADPTNDCPMPAVLDNGAGFPRVAVLHDNLVANVYYQYFTPAQAAMVGFGGLTAGMSVFQWVGGHFFPAGSVVDAQLVLFHQDDSMLVMVAADSDNGQQSTMGLQNGAATTGLEYGCNSAGYLAPGMTAVWLRPPDSDCCSASAAGLPGCGVPSCSASVCAIDPTCCTTEWTAACGALAAGSCPIVCGGLPPVTINELRTDQNGTENDEYFELTGPPGTSLDGLTYIVLGDVPTGHIEAVIDLSGQVIPPSGYLVVAEPSFTLGVADLVTTLNFENNDTVTHMLVAGFLGALDDDLDLDTNGVLDATPWFALLDTVAILDAGGQEFSYGPGSACMAGPTCQNVAQAGGVPNQIFRCPDGAGTWVIGQVAIGGGTDTPGAANDCAGCGDGVLDPGEDCDAMGESAACDADCSFALCGDGLVNVTAGEVCDDVVESAICNIDCSLASCGDGIVNMTSGEACDDMVESAVCNADCSLAMCGDGIVNMAAGEGCDDMGESAACDADCSLASCGDGLVNMTAGEECDDMGESAVCDVDCTVVVCGDGVTNMSAGESCDDAGESVACNADCSIAGCGDGLVNTTAGEECDESGTTAGCDDDCTLPECGDGTLNMEAGEECDDGNLDDGDGCAADCTEEVDPTTGGMDTTGSGSSSGDDTSGTGTTTGPDDSTSSSAGSTGGSTSDAADGSTGSSSSSGGDDAPYDPGCNCTTRPRGGGPWPAWLLLAVGAAIRRRRRA